jgi:hypothetical protein
MDPDRGGGAGLDRGKAVEVPLLHDTRPVPACEAGVFPPGCRPGRGDGMSRGRRSEKALAAAVPVAMMRGEVMFLEQRPGTCFDFLASGPAGTSAIRVELALRIHGSPAEIAQDHAEALARVSAAALAPGISRELWLWSPWGTMRYFRIEGEAITELDRFGTVRAPLVKGALAGAKRPRWRKPRKKAGGAAVVPGPGPGQPPAAGNSLQPAGTSMPDPAGITQPPGTPGPAPAPSASGTREPAPVRYLKRRAAEKKRLKEAQAAVPGYAPAAPGTGEIPSIGGTDPLS